jgi:hypothetical protein
VNLKDILPISKLKSFKKISSTTITSFRRTFSYQLSFANGQVIQVSINVICETAPYTPASHGTWGVNPHSALNVVQVIRKPDIKKIVREEKSR